MSRSNRRTVRESRWLKVLGTLNEYQARLFVADKALDQGRGGITRLSELTGMSRTTITKAVADSVLAEKDRWRPGDEALEKGREMGLSKRQVPITVLARHAGQRKCF